MVIAHHLGKKTSLKGLNAIFLEKVKNEMLPYFIDSCKIKSPDELYIKLEGISSKEAAQKLTQKEVWLLEEDFNKYAAKSRNIIAGLPYDARWNDWARYWK
jgi:16S rRNA processing protein RimM